MTSDGGKGRDKLKTKKNTTTIHYITENWKLKNDTLQVKPTKGKQDNKLITAEWKKCLSKYDLLKNNEEEKIHFGMTTDAGANMKAARQKGTTDFDLMLENESDCFDHQCHLLIKETVAEIPELTAAKSKAHEIVTHFALSSKRREDFRDLQKDNWSK